MEQPGDEELIEKSKAGDMTAFKMLVKKHEGQVAGVIRTLLGATPEAEDVGQEVFIRFYDSLNKFRGDSKLSTYLVRIAINLSLNELKKRKRSTSRYASLEAADGVGGVEDMLDLKEHLQYAFEKLDPDFRAVATLRLVEGYSTEETAGILEIPIGTALSRLARAQQKLRTSLSKKLRP
jgi:RNA polymerase sigma-70 factor, ECF subfamily